ncbi:MAG: peptidylprolyl isomerase [Thermoplasmata archaeon]|nr:MAG: peptidylprolyl isomerase [Thermoplasmata archaeon]
MMKAIIETDKGRIVLELFENDAPNTVRNFTDLARKGFYDGLTFHRVIPDFMVQAGCPKGTGTGGPGYQIDCELESGRKHGTGSLSMAHAGSCSHDRASGRKIGGECSNGSQFFITHSPQPHLDGVHTVFGQVIEGQDVVNAIRKGDMMRKVAIED